MDWSKIKHFTPREFDSPDCPGSGEKMSQILVDKLDEIRNKYGRSIRISSGYRTPEHNRIVGGVDSSAHVNGDGADLAVQSSAERFQLIQLALSVGIRRIGVGKTFIHVDVATYLPDGVIWMY